MRIFKGQCVLLLVKKTLNGVEIIAQDAMNNESAGIKSMDTKETIKKFIVNHFLKGDKSRSLSDDDSFIEQGIIDSIGVLELVAFLEEKFGFRVGDEEIVPENFDSVNKLDSFVQSKLAKVRS